MKQVHYNLDNINEKYPDAFYYLIYGEKSNGKSYQVKHKEAVLHYLETGKKFILLRRWKEDISTAWIEKYFSDVDVEKITNKLLENEYIEKCYLSEIDTSTGIITVNITAPNELYNETLREINKDDTFIYKLLDNKKITLKDIFYAFYKDKNIFVIKYIGFAALFLPSIPIQ